MSWSTYVLMALGASGALLAFAGAIWILVQARRHPAQPHRRLYDMEDAERRVGGGL